MDDNRISNVEERIVHIEINMLAVESEQAVCRRKKSSGKHRLGLVPSVLVGWTDST